MYRTPTHVPTPCTPPPSHHHLPPDALPPTTQAGAGRPVAQWCEEVITGTCAKHGWGILALALQPDHLPLFVGREWPSDGAAEIAKECQGRGALHLRDAFPLQRTLPARW